MGYRRKPRIADGLLVIGIAISMICLMTLSIPHTELPVTVASLLTERSASPVVLTSPMTSHVRRGHHAASIAVSSDPQKIVQTAPSGRIASRADQGGQDDPRTYLQEAAAVAQRYPWAGPWRGETRTDLWINAPGSIGSTSPPAE